MANIKSAKKRILVAETKAARNKAIRSKVKTSVKKVEAAITAGDKAAAQAALISCYKRNRQGYFQGRISQEYCFQKSIPFVQSCKRYGLIRRLDILIYKFVK